MPIYHIVWHGYKAEPSERVLKERYAMFQSAFGDASFIERGIVGRYLGPDDGYHDAVCVKFQDLECYRKHMLTSYHIDEAAHLRETVLRIRAFDIITPDEPDDTEAKIIGLYKERWKLFPEVAKVLREEIDARMPGL